jgi:hypothetical protein
MAINFGEIQSLQNRMLRSNQFIEFLTVAGQKKTVFDEDSLPVSNNISR